MRARRVLASGVLALVLPVTGGGEAWARGAPGRAAVGGDQHAAPACPRASAGPAASAGRAALLSLPPPGAPGPLPPLPTSGAPETPDRDPFYDPPGGFAACPPGTVLRARVVRILGPTSLTGSTSAHQLLFRSEDAPGHPIAAVTTLLTPAVPAPGPRKVVSYQVFEDSLTTGCAPSYTLRTNSGLPQPIENGVLASLLGNGWDVLIPDHQGPRSEFVVGRTAGRITLDSIRAVERFRPAGLDGTRTPVGLMGYSGGSVPTVWANALAAAHAPELNLVGAAAGGIIAHVDAIFRGITGPPFFGGVLAFGVGLDRAYPSFDYDDLLNDRGRAQVARDGRDADGCAGFAYNAPSATVPGYTRFPTIDGLLAVPRVRRVMAKVNLIRGPPFTVPSLFVQGAQDELALPGQVDDLVAANCRRHATIDYRRVPGEHFSTLPLYATRSVEFLRDRFSGRPAIDSCPRGTQ